MNHEENVSKYYDKDYFNWQNQDGSFGGWVNKNFFQKNINLNDTVIDFGCGGGFLLKNLSCKRRIGIEPNLSAKKSIEKNGVEHFSSPQEMLDTLGSEIADVIISTNVLEHTLNPLIELQNLRKILKKNGVIHFIVQCDSINYK
jgi:2-polyprenyl-3-methyl-5-hydroxy-6-metoxy-1,4-benzoquinol methylase